MSNSYTFYVDSRDAYIVGDSPADILLVNVLGSNLASDHYSISIEQAIIPNLEYPINSKNNTIVFREASDDATTYTATLTKGNYTGTTLAAEIATQMTAVTGNGYTYTASFDTSTLKLDISAGLPDVFKIVEANDTLGYNVGTSFVSSKIGDLPVRLDGTQYIDIVSNLQTLNLTSSGRTNVLARIQNVVNYGGILFYQNQNDADSTQISNGALDRFELQLRDDRGRLLELPANSHFSLAFRLTRIS